MNDIHIIPIGSGSTGNSIYFELKGHRFLVDMGIGYRKVRDALFMHDRDLSDIEAVFVTHGHHDHVKAAVPISNHIHCPVYADSTSMYSLSGIKAERIVLEINQETDIQGLCVTMFPVPHDYVKTTGYIFQCDNRKIAYVTDCGRMNEQILSHMLGADVAVLESNHDIEMLRKGPYPRQLQDRILSKYGHLSNDECAQTIEYLYQNGTRNFILAHISRQNNTPEKAYETAMNRMQGKDVNIYVCPVEGKDLLSF